MNDIAEFDDVLLVVFAFWCYLRVQLSTYLLMYGGNFRAWAETLGKLPTAACKSSDISSE